MNQKSFYESQLKYYTEQVSIYHKKEKTIAISRLMVFLLGIFFLYLTFSTVWLFFLILVAEIITFLYLVRKFEDAKIAHQKAKLGKQINEFELVSLDGNHVSFDAGLEFFDPNHPFSNDLDIFREKGIFSFINRTTSQLGKQKLVAQILNGVEHPENENQIIEALSDEITWTQKFRIASLIQKKSQSENNQKHSFQIQKVKAFPFAKLLIFLLPIITISAVTLSYFDIISNTLLSVAIILSLIPFSKTLASTNKLMHELSAFENKTLTSLQQIQILNELSSNNEVILKIKDQLISGEKSALKAFQELYEISRMMEARMNILLLLPLNIFLAWDTRYNLKFEKWFDTYAAEINYWFELLAQLEVYISGATVRYNYKENTTFAQFTSDKNIEFTELMHPLIQSENAIANDLILDSNKQFMILTGPNMAGKSTYLRSVGLTIAFANAGFPIFAKQAKIPRMKLFSSMRTVDDINNQSSYFHAELSRLRYIMDEIEKDSNCFILLDEILKGTNSIDKEQGSKKFLAKLQRLNAQGIIATHDLALCELEASNAAFVNACFDSNINGESLTFDYKLRKGICQNMNASFLLKQMKLVD